MTESFKTLCGMRLKESRALLDAGEYSGSYYLAGYSLECALKAVILKDIRQYRMPDRKMVDKAHTHDLDELVTQAGLKAQKAALESTNPAFGRNWAVARAWNESSRYEAWTHQEASELLTAITRRGSGVLPWVKKSW